MFRIFIIWISIGFFYSIPPQSFGDNFKFSFPDLVQKGKSFEISIITSNDLEKADKLDLYIIPQRGIKLESVTLRTENNSRELEFSSASSKGYLYDAVICTVGLSESSIGSGSFFQVFLKFSSENVNYSEIEFYGEFIKDNRTVGYLQSSNNNISSEYPNHFRAKINFYASDFGNDKTLVLKPNSEFSIDTDLNIKKDMLIDFWINFNQNALTFLEIKNKLTNLVEYSLVTNDFQILSAESDFQSVNNISPRFISSKLWLHFSILFSFSKSNIEFFCDRKKFADFKLPISLPSKDIIISFINNTTAGYKLDQLRIIDYNDPIEVAFKNRYYPNFISDKSAVKFQSNFNESSVNDLQTNNHIYLDNCVLTPSDAPIFSRAPELNLRLMNNYYELNWSGGDYANADYYIVERAGGESGFTELQRVEAEKKKDKIYSYLSDRRDESEIIYFRVKQVNTDGSIVYSSQLKVGQGTLEEFSLEQNYPNPFNPVTQISIDVLVDSDFEIVVYNLEGQKVAELFRGFLAKGEHQFTFDGSELPSGIYLYKAWSPNFSQTKKMILAK